MRRCQMFRVWVALMLSVLLLAGCVTLTPTAPPQLTSTPLPSATPTAVPPAPTPNPVIVALHEGDRLLWSNEWAGAEAAYRQALTLEPENVAARGRLIYLLTLRPARHQEAFDLAEETVELAPDSAEAQASLATALLTYNRVEDALQAVEKAAQLDAESLTVHRARAWVYLKAGRYEDALSAARQATTLNPGNPEAWLAQVAVQGSTNRPLDALASLETLTDVAPEWVWTHLAWGQWHMDRHNIEAARAAYQRALELAPDYAPALFAMGNYYMDQKDYETALAYYDQAAKLAPEYGRFHVARGFAYLDQDETTKAEKAFRTVLDLDAWEGEAYLGLGRMALERLACQEAQDHFQQATERMPYEAAGYIGLGLAHLCLLQPSQTRLAAQRAVELDPYNPQSHLVLGAYYFIQGDMEQALETFRDALALDFWNADTYARLGTLYLARKQWDEAEQSFRQSLTLDATNNQAHTGLGWVYLDQRHYDKALTAFEQAIALDKEDGQAYAGLGIAQLRLGQAEEAANSLEQALSLGYETPQVLFYQAKAYQEMGDTDNAMTVLRDILVTATDSMDQVRASYKLSALEEGYTLSDAEALQEAQDILERLNLKATLDLVDDPDVGRHLKIVILLDREIDTSTSEVASSIGAALAVGALVLPRLESTWDGGLMVEVHTPEGKALARATMAQESVMDWADGLITMQEFVLQAHLRDLTRPEAGPPTTPSALEAVAEAVEAVRGLQGTEPLRYTYMDRAQLREEMEKRFKEKPEKQKADQALFTVLDLIPPEVDLTQLLIDLNAEEVLGFYDPDDGTFRIVDEDENMSLRDEFTIAHEYAHALQDQHFGLDRLDDEALNGDAQAAFSALVEGDALLTAILYLTQNASPMELETLGSDAALREETERLASVPYAIRQIMLFPYFHGLTFVKALAPDEQWDRLNAAFNEPPVSTEQILHPEKYEAGDLPQEVSLPDLETLDEAWEVLDSDVFGEFGILLYLGQYVAPDLAAVAGAGWDGDRYLLLERPSDGALALVWAHVWDTVEDADQFFQAHRLYLESQTEYTLDRETITSYRQAMQWKRPERWVFVEQSGAHTRLFIAPDKQTLTLLTTSLPALAEP